MGIMKWIGLDELDPFFKGEFSSTIGDSLDAVYGGRHVHTIGERTALTVSPWSLLRLRALGASYAGLSALFLGNSGDARYVIGKDTQGIYKGPVNRVYRAAKTERLMPPIFKDPEQTLEDIQLGVESAANIDPADVALETTVLAMMRLTAAITILFELTIHFAYPSYGAGDDEATVPEVINLLGGAIVSRMLAITQYLEMSGSESVFSQERIEQAIAAGTAWTPSMMLGLWGDEATALSRAAKTTLRETWTSIRAEITAERAMIALALMVAIVPAAVAVGIACAQD